MGEEKALNINGLEQFPVGGYVRNNATQWYQGLAGLLEITYPNCISSQCEHIDSSIIRQAFADQLFITYIYSSDGVTITPHRVITNITHNKTSFNVCFSVPRNYTLHNSNFEFSLMLSASPFGFFSCYFFPNNNFYLTKFWCLWLKFSFIFLFQKIEILNYLRLKGESTGTTNQIFTHQIIAIQEHSFNLTFYLQSF